MEERYFIIYVNLFFFIYFLDYFMFDILILQGEELDQYVLIFCNVIGNLVDLKYVKMQLFYVVMNLVSNLYLYFVVVSIWGLKDMFDCVVVDIE